jgi:hypothetical protein
MCLASALGLDMVTFQLGHHMTRKLYKHVQDDIYALIGDSIFMNEDLKKEL